MTLRKAKNFSSKTINHKTLRFLAEFYCRGRWKVRKESCYASVEADTRDRKLNQIFFKWHSPGNEWHNKANKRKIVPHWFRFLSEQKFASLYMTFQSRLKERKINKMKIFNFLFLVFLFRFLSFRLQKVCVWVCRAEQWGSFWQFNFHSSCIEFHRRCDNKRRKKKVAKEGNLGDVTARGGQIRMNSYNWNFCSK